MATSPAAQAISAVTRVVPMSVEQENNARVKAESDSFVREQLVDYFIAITKSAPKLRHKIAMGSGSAAYKWQSVKEYISDNNLEQALIATGASLSAVEGVMHVVPSLMSNNAEHLAHQFECTDHGLTRAREGVDTTMESLLTAHELKEKKEAVELVEEAQEHVSESKKNDRAFIERRATRMKNKQFWGKMFAGGAISTAVVSVITAASDHWLEHKAWFASSFVPAAAVMVAARDSYKAYKDLKSAYRAHKRTDEVYLWFDRYTKWVHAKAQAEHLKKQGQSTKKTVEWHVKAERYKVQLDAVYEGLPRSFRENPNYCFAGSDHFLRPDQQSMCKVALKRFKPTHVYKNGRGTKIRQALIEQHDRKSKRLALRGGLRLVRAIGLGCIALGCIPGLHPLAGIGLMITAAAGVFQLIQVGANFNRTRLKTAEKHYINEQQQNSVSYNSDLDIEAEDAEISTQFNQFKNMPKALPDKNSIKFCLKQAYHYQCCARKIIPNKPEYTFSMFWSALKSQPPHVRDELLIAAKTRFCQDEFLCNVNGIKDPDEKKQYLSSLSTKQRIIELKAAVKQHKAASRSERRQKVNYVSQAIARMC